MRTSLGIFIGSFKLNLGYQILKKNKAQNKDTEERVVSAPLEDLIKS